MYWRNRTKVRSAGSSSCCCVVGDKEVCMTIGAWMMLAVTVGAVVWSGRSRTANRAGCALLLILVCFVVLVWLHLLAG